MARAVHVDVRDGSRPSGTWIEARRPRWVPHIHRSSCVVAARRRATGIGDEPHAARVIHNQRTSDRALPTVVPSRENRVNHVDRKLKPSVNARVMAVSRAPLHICSFGNGDPVGSRVTPARRLATGSTGFGGGIAPTPADAIYYDAPGCAATGMPLPMEVAPQFPLVIGSGSVAGDCVGLRAIRSAGRGWRPAPTRSRIRASRSVASINRYLRSP